MKWIFLIIILGTMIYMTQVVSAENFQYNLNETETPINFTDFLFITTDVNATLTFIHKNFTSSINSTQLNETTNTFNLSFNVSLPKLNIGNYTTFFTIHKQINSTETFTNITFLIKILNSSKINASLFEIGFNEYSSEVCDTSLPFDSSLTTSIKLSVDINPVCDSFLSCPGIIFPSETSVKINISIPKGTIPNNYIKIANFGSNIGNITFHFKVKDCFFDLTQFCGNVSTVEQLVACQSALLENLKKINKTITVEKNNTEYVNNSEVQYKQILPLENDTAQMLREFATSWRTIQSEKDRLEKENKDLSSTYQTNLVTMQGEISKLASEMDIKIKQTFLDLYLENQNLTKSNIEIEEKSWSKSRVTWSILGIVLIVGLVLGFFKLKKEMIY